MDVKTDAKEYYRWKKKINKSEFQLLNLSDLSPKKVCSMEPSWFVHRQLRKPLTKPSGTIQAVNFLSTLKWKKVDLRGPDFHLQIRGQIYPLVNIQKTMENHHLEWENSLFLWPCSIAMLVITRGYTGYQLSRQMACHLRHILQQVLNPTNEIWSPLKTWSSKYSEATCTSHPTC